MSQESKRVKKNGKYFASLIGATTWENLSPVVQRLVISLGVTADHLRDNPVLCYETGGAGDTAPIKVEQSSLYLSGWLKDQRQNAQLFPLRQVVTSIEGATVSDVVEALLVLDNTADYLLRCARMPSTRESLEQHFAAVLKYRSITGWNQGLPDSADGSVRFGARGASMGSGGGLAEGFLAGMPNGRQLEELLNSSD